MGERNDGQGDTERVPESVSSYPLPAFALDATWTIVAVALANYPDAFPEITVGAHFFDLLFAFPRSLPRTARAELHTAHWEITRALTYFEYFVVATMDRAQQRHLMDTLGTRVSLAGRLPSFTDLRQDARTALQQLAPRYATLTFNEPVRIATLSLRSPFDRMLILRFHCALQREPSVPPTPQGPGRDARWWVTLQPQNDLTAEALALMDHWKVETLQEVITGYHDMIHALIFMEKENPYRGDDPTTDIDPAADVVRTPEPRAERPTPTRTEAEEALVADLAARGVPFETVPDVVFPGMHYVTPRALVASGVTRYSQNHILLLIRRHEVAALTLGGNVVLDAFAVQQLLDREAESARENVHAGGRRPGPRRTRAQRREEPA